MRNDKFEVVGWGRGNRLGLDLLFGVDWEDSDMVCWIYCWVWRLLEY